MPRRKGVIYMKYEEPEMPDPSDYIKEHSGPLGARVSVGSEDGGHLGEFRTEAEADVAIFRNMEKNKFWPNVWSLSDHGNYHINKDFSKTVKGILKNARRTGVLEY
jgi:hypothetical protein